MGTKANPKSSWPEYKPEGGWLGGAAFNDGHSEWLNSSTLDTHYGEIENKNDHLFQLHGNDDALMLRTGN